MVWYHGDRSVGAMLVLHVDDACYGGHGKQYEQAMEKLRKSLSIGKIETTEFEFLGRVVKQLPDYTVEIHQCKSHIVMPI